MQRYLWLVLPRIYCNNTLDSQHDKMTKRILFTMLTLLGGLQLLVAQGTITGNISSKLDGPLIGASVVIQGTSRGTVTDFDGNFELNYDTPDQVLVISYTGYNTQEVTIGNQTNLSIVLTDNIALIDEVVVVGYGTQKRSTISGAVSTVSSADITEAPVLRTEQALQGRIAGVQVAQNSGSPGSALTVRVRGTGTINNSDPLYIVDGIPVDGIDF